MFGNIKAINKNYAIVSLTTDAKALGDILNLHVIFEDKDKRILGEVEDIDGSSVKINFLGEINNKSFIGGLIKKPSLDASVRIINQNELHVLVGGDEKSFTLGVSPLYKNYPVSVNLNDLFSNHSAIFGNSGSGKTYGICRIIQNVFSMPNVPYKANMFIFDSYGEYINAFKDINNINPNLHYKLITTNKRLIREGSEKLQIPVSLLTIDDVLNVLDATKFSQISIVETAIELAKIFASKSKEVNDYKNHLLAKAITSIMYTNQTSAKIRDQIFDIVANTYTEQINLNAVIPGIGFTRIFRHCFDIDSEGRFAERTIIAEYIESFIQDEREWNIDTSNVTYGLKELEVALNFTLFSERYLLNPDMYDEAISLKVKLHNLINSSNSSFFTDKKFTSIKDYISYLVTTNEGKKAQIININLEDVDDRFARTVTKIFGRLFLTFGKTNEPRASIPIHIILEEAHRYVIQNDDVGLLGYNIFERIAKEGRKHGVIIDLITQRPTDLNSNVISQADNFIIFKITHPEDLDYITRMIPNMSADIIEKQKCLQPGTCVSFGRILKIPMIVKMQKADPPPESANADIFGTWMIAKKKDENIETSEEKDNTPKEETPETQNENIETNTQKVEE